MVEADESNNGSLNEDGHTGDIRSLGELTTNKVGNGNPHFDFDLSTFGDGDSPMFGHLDFKAQDECEELEGDLVETNEYGAAPDPTLNTPLTWME